MEQIKKDKISVITVVFNDAGNIRKTIESFLTQKWENKEYIIIDGGSTDGTVDIIKEYQQYLSYWCSEKDEGIYDAMNKGIHHATGEWINFLNSGDRYVDEFSLQNCMLSDIQEETHIIYGNSIEVDKVFDKRIIASSDTTFLETRPIFRHGSSLIRSDIQKKNLFDISKSKKLGYSLDWELIHRLYRTGHKFQKVDVMLEAYLKEGISNHQYLNLWYNYKITSNGSFSITKFAFFIRSCITIFILTSPFYKWFRTFLLDFLINDILPVFPSWTLRKCIFRALGAKIDQNSYIMKKNYIINANLLKIGKHSHINRGCTIDARGSIEIEDNVSVSYNVNLITGGHDVNSPTFHGVFHPIHIKEYAWLGVGCTILQGVTIGKGAVVCAGAVVTKDVNDYDIVAGIPAKKIGVRTHHLNYNCLWK